MGLTVELRGEFGDVLGVAGEHASNTGWGVLPKFDTEEFPLLRYVDRYGTTVYNEEQMRDLLPELYELKSRAKHAETKRVVDGIIKLAERGASESHLFLWWKGD